MPKQIIDFTKTSHYDFATGEVNAETASQLSSEYPGDDSTKLILHLDGNLQDATGLNNPTAVGTANYVSGQVGPQAFDCGAGEQVIDCGNDSALAANDGVAVSLWAYLSDIHDDQNHGLIGRRQTEAEGSSWVLYAKQDTLKPVWEVSNVVEEEYLEGESGNDTDTVLLLSMNDTSFADYSLGGSDHTFTNHGASVVAAPTGWTNAADFTGGDHYIDTPAHADFSFGSSEFCIDFRVKRNSTGTVQRIFGNLHSTGGNTGANVYAYFQADNTLKVRLISGGTSYDCVTTSSITDTDWHHVAIARDNDTLRLFIDGVQNQTVDLSGVTLDTATNNFAIGRNGEYSGDYFDGQVDKFRIIKDTVDPDYRGSAGFDIPTAPYGQLTHLQEYIWRWEGTNNLATNQWYHLALSYDHETSTPQLWINGQPETLTLTESDGVGPNLNDSSAKLYVGGYINDDDELGHRLPGYIDEVIYWNDPQSEELLNQIYTLQNLELPYSTTRPSIQATTPLSLEFVSGYQGMSEQSSGGEIKYQLSNDQGETWQKYDVDEKEWGEVTEVDGNTVTELGIGLSKFAVGDDKTLHIRAILGSVYSPSITLDKIQINYVDLEEAVWLNIGGANTSISTTELARYVDLAVAEYSQEFPLIKEVKLTVTNERAKLPEDLIEIISPDPLGYELREGYLKTSLADGETIELVYMGQHQAATVPAPDRELVTLYASSLAKKDLVRDHIGNFKYTGGGGENTDKTGIAELYRAEAEADLKRYQELVRKRGGRSYQLNVSHITRT